MLNYYWTKEGPKNILILFRDKITQTTVWPAHNLFKDRPHEQLIDYEHGYLYSDGTRQTRCPSINKP